MPMKQLVAYFVDGTEVDFHKMLDVGLIEQINDGFVLTSFGRSFLDF
jgi:hypothetical protein